MSRLARIARLAAVGIVVARSLSASPGGEPCYVESAELVPDDGATMDSFGYSVAASGDTLVVGSRGHEVNGIRAGAAYVFVRVGGAWIQQAELAAADLDYGQEFGSGVDVDGDTAIVAAPFDDQLGGSSGAVYVFVRNGGAWTQQAKLVASDGATADFFGNGIALSGERILVGSPGDDDHGSFSGSAYVFVRSGTSWTQEAKLTASDGATEDQFGDALGLSGDLAVVGAWGDGVLSGSAYVFARGANGWVQQAKLRASDASAGRRFGSAVALEGSTLLVGAVFAAGTLPQSGAVYAFVRSGVDWVEQAKLFPRHGSPPETFAHAVSLSGDAALVGAPYHDGTSVRSGAAYVFLRQGGVWSEHVELDGRHLAPADQMGVAVALDGTTAVATSITADGSAMDSGKAYVFDVPPRPGAIFCTCASGPCGNSDAGAGCANSTGSGARLTAAGTTAPDEVNLFVSDVPAGRFGSFIHSNSSATMPFGDGLRCVGGAPALLTRSPRESAPDGSVGYGPCFGDAPLSGASGVNPGSGTIERYQFWYRDPGGPCGSNFNLSNGFSIVW